MFALLSVSVPAPDLSSASVEVSALRGKLVGCLEQQAEACQDTVRAPVVLRKAAAEAVARVSPPAQAESVRQNGKRVRSSTVFPLYMLGGFDRIKL